MNTQFTVGEIARLSHLSKQTLIYYDREGIFSPQAVNPHNGYRYYTADQLEVLDSILILKEMGLSLKQIKAFMSSRSRENTISLMESQYLEIQKKLHHLQMTKRRLTRKLDTLRHFYAGEKQVDFIECTETEPLAVEQVKPPFGLLELDIALKELLYRAGREGYSHYYQMGAMLPVANLLEGKYTQAQYAFLPLESNAPAQELQKPIGKYARGYHTGAYEQVGASYRRILKAIGQAGLRPVGYSYEYCIFDSLTTPDTTDYVTEIQIRVE